jgi:hypothetical protein
MYEHIQIYKMYIKILRHGKLDFYLQLDIPGILKWYFMYVRRNHGLISSQ